MIPKVIHFCWFGRGEKPALVKKCIKSWRKNCPDFEIIEWNEDNFNIDYNAYTRYCYDNKKWAFLSDLARLIIIYENGGVYVDTDVEILKSFVPLLKYRAFYGYENNEYVASGLGFGAEAKDATIKAMIEEYEKLQVLDDGSYPLVVCPTLNTAALRDFGFIINGKRQIIDKRILLPWYYLNPMDSATGRISKTKNTLSIHHYSMSWLSKRRQLRSRVTRIFHRLFGVNCFDWLKKKDVNNTHKKMIIVSHAMDLGGVETSLLGLLETIDTDKYDVDLFLFRHEGPLLEYIPNRINLLPEKKSFSCLAIPFTYVLKKGQFGMAIGRILGKKLAAIRIKKINLAKDNDVALQYSHKYTKCFVPKISKKKYDVAISFLTPHYFVTDKVEANKKIAWIHTDYSSVAIDQKEQLKMWSKYDHIISISDLVTAAFIEKMPSLSDKIVMLPNIVPENYILRKASEFTCEKEMPFGDALNILSIGRFCYPKNFESIPQISKLLIEKGINLRWYIIGYGKDEKKIRNSIIENDMENHVIILGKKENPYPYISACDLYIQPSRYEGKCVAVIEAQMLHKPVIITNYATAESQLENGVDGVIVPLETKECAEKIYEIVQNKEFLKQIANNTKLKDYTNKSSIKLLYKLCKENED